MEKIKLNRKVDVTELLVNIINSAQRTYDEELKEKVIFDIHYGNCSIYTYQNKSIDLVAIFKRQLYLYFDNSQHNKIKKIKKIVFYFGHAKIEKIQFRTH